MDLDTLLEPLDTLGLRPSPETLRALTEFHRGLYTHNESKNLTRIPPEEAATKHYLDSVLFHDLIPEGATVLDIGTGAGFPAWPLALLRPDLAVTAIDSNGKMLEFLQKYPLPNLRTILARAEEFPHREAFGVVTGRAVAPLPIQLEISAALCKPQGLVIPLRTPSDDPSTVPHRLLGLELEQVIDRPLPGTDIVRRFPVYRKAGPTPRRYPRRWAEIKKKPLGAPETDPEPGPEAIP